MEKSKRKSVMEYMKVFSPCCKDYDYIEVVEWTNGEGWDITIECGNEVKRFSLHMDEFDAIKHLISVLTYGFEKVSNS